MKDNGTLIKGRIYDPSALVCIGWTVGDGTGHQCYDYRDYFTEKDADSWQYLGKDCHNIEPQFERLRSSYNEADLKHDMEWKHEISA